MIISFSPEELILIGGYLLYKNDADWCIPLKTHGDWWISLHMSYTKVYPYSQMKAQNDWKKSLNKAMLIGEFLFSAENPTLIGGFSAPRP
jgi:hypothetical protein